MKDLLSVIKKRQSIRVSHDLSKPISKDDLLKILEAGSWAPTAHNMQNFEVIVINDRKILEAIGDIKFTMPKTFIEENNRYFSITLEELKKKKVGGLGRLPIKLTEQGETDDFTHKMLRKSFRETDTLLILMYDSRQRAPGSEGDFLGNISLGCVLENMWLMASYLGIGLHIVSAVTWEDYINQMKDILEIPEYFNLALSCRLGYPVSVEDNYTRVRRDVADFTYYNRFGNKNKNV